MPTKKYGDRLSIDDISSPFEAFGMTADYKADLLNKYNNAVFGDSNTSNTVVGSLGGQSSNEGIRDVDPKKYDPGTFSYNTDLDLPDYKVGATFQAPSYTSPDFSSLGDTPSYTQPEAYKIGNYDAPQYTAPKYNERKVNALTQQQAAPAIRGLRSAIMRVQNTQGENQNVNRMTLRDALAGYGQGLQSAMSGASATARGLYNEEYSRETDAAKTNFGARADAAKTSYTTQADASKTNYLANVDAAKMNFEAQYDKYKMKWSELSDAAKMNYTSKYNESLQNYQSKLDEGKINNQNLVDAKKMAYQGNLDVAKMNYGTQADWKKTQYGVENQKAMAEYDAALKKYMQETQINSTEKMKAPGVQFAGTSSSEPWGTPLQSKSWDMAQDRWTVPTRTK